MTDDWARLPEEELLSLRLRDLDIEVESSGDLLAPAVARLERQLAGRGLKFRPHVWLGDEWFCPDGVPGFAVPFYLAHPRLRKLERKHMLELEGGTLRSCMRLLRHEAGHAIDNAYRLRRWPDRKRVFGDPSVDYPDYYVPRPYSRRYVRHLQLGYAQAHPDEDFAETFAVWLDPGSRWRKRYKGWPALEKLRFMDETIREIARSRPALRNRRMPGRISELNETLGEHYRDKRRRYRIDNVDHYDEELGRIFASKGRWSAVEFLRKHRRALRQHVSHWTGARRYTVDELLQEWIKRARLKRLRVRNADDAFRDTTTALTVRVMEYLHNDHDRVVL
jgi:hypothetical protein